MTDEITHHSSLTTGDIAGGIHGSILAGRDVQLIVQVVQQAGLAMPSPHDQPALLETLRQAQGRPVSAVEQAAIMATITALEQAIAGRPRQEQAYLQRVQARYAKPATVFVELEADTYEPGEPAQPDPDILDMSAVAELMRHSRTMPDLEEWQVRGQEIRRVRLNSLREGVDKHPCLILLGDPGSGKTTALENLAYRFATDMLQSAPPPPLLPLSLRLSEFGPTDASVEAFILRSWRGPTESDHWGAPELAANLTGYLAAGRLCILFDALNEMPATGFAARAAALREFIARWQPSGNRFVVSCRVLDYEQELHGLQRVELRPFSNEQIRTFLQKVLHHHWPPMWTALTGGGDAAHQLLAMARNPYLLTMMVSEFTRRHGRLSPNRAELMSGFTSTLLRWAKRKCRGEWLPAAVQREALSVTAFEMQHRNGSGAAVETALVKTVMPTAVQPDPRWPPLTVPPERVLELAASANIVELPVDRSTVRFYHQLLQEYFAARELLKRMRSPSIPPKGGEAQPPLPPGEGWGEGLAELWRWPWLESDMPPVGERGDYDPLPPPPPTGWEETTILAAGLAVENDDQLVRALIGVNPVLAGRCLHEGQAKVDRATRQAVLEALLATLARPEVALRVRIAAGEVLGFLGDPRLRDMVTIPAGKFVLGDDDLTDDEKPQHQLYLPEYRIARYPLTNDEFAPFLEAGGYRDRRWWTEAGWQQKEEAPWTEPRYWQDSRFNKPNQPVVGISWYESVAYCRWRSAETGQTIRLPGEAEWEKATRGTDGRSFPWGNQFDPARVNMDLGEQVVNATTPVGLYPTGTSPYGLYDCAGNVWEWCATKVGGDFSNPKFKPYPYRVEDEWTEEYLNGTSVRVLRGGTWIYDNQDNARCAFRNRLDPWIRFDVGGCRLLVSPI